MIKEEIKNKNSNEIRTQILQLINDETVAENIEENFIFPDLKKRKTFFLTLLVYSGYLTTVQQISRKKHELIIPNYEIKTIFQDTILEWLDADVKVTQKLLENTTNYLVNNELGLFEKGFKQIVGDTISYFDITETGTGKKYILKEQYFHVYTLGILTILSDDYVIKSNRESGEGRYDIMLIPHDKTKYGIVIEIKQTEKQQNTEEKNDFFLRVNKQIKAATNQIEKNKYYKELIDNKIDSERIIKVPIVFAGKEPFITIVEK